MPRKKKGPGRPPGSKKSSKSSTSNSNTNTNTNITSSTNNNTNTNATSSSRRKRRAPPDQSSPYDNQSNTLPPSSKTRVSKRDDSKSSTETETMLKMYAIAHHTSFIPALQCPNPLITKNEHTLNLTFSSTATTSNSNSNNSSNNNNNNSNNNNPNLHQEEAIIDHESNYNLYHPRNLGAQSMPNVQSNQPPPPHSAGCRMSSISCPSWNSVPQSTIMHCNREVIKCTTVMNSNSEYVVMGDTSGYITLYSIAPLFRPITVLSTTNSKRCQTQDEVKYSNGCHIRKTKRIGVADKVSLSSIDRMFAIDAVVVGKGGVVVGTRYEVEYISLEDEILWTLSIIDVAGSDGISMDDSSNNNNSNHQNKNSNDDSTSIGNADGGDGDGDGGDSNADSNADSNTDGNTDRNTDGNADGNADDTNSEDQEKRKKCKDDLIRDAPFHFDLGSGGILASFELRHRPNSKKSSATVTEELEESEVASSTSTGATATAAETTPLNDTSSDDTNDKSQENNQAPNLSSPIWHIETKTGKATSVIPKEYANNQWQDVIIGHRAMAIWDKSIAYANNILAVYITQHSTTRDIQQELLLLNNSQQVIFRATLPTKSSSSKIMTCEAISQSQRGTFSIAATSARGGIRLFKTDGLVHLGTYGEGVSLHGHSIFWQDCFFIEMGSVNNDYASKDNSNFLDRKLDNGNDNVNDNDKKSNIEDPSSGQEQWGQIFERKDELRHRGACKSQEIEKIKTGEEETLKGLHIVSVPHAFREPVDMKETIHFWDVTTCELDSGNKLPSFTLVGPKKSGGVLNFIHDQTFPTSHASRFVLSTHNGECVQLTPTMTSDWAGQMYPAGYSVIDNNLIYIEDEDELDKVVAIPMESETLCKTEKGSWRNNGKIKGDTDLEEALRISMVDEIVDVVNDDNAEDIDPFAFASTQDIVTSFPSCRPEPHLRERLKKATDDDDTVANNPDSLDASDRQHDVDILRHFPQELIVKGILETEQEKSEKRRLAIEAKLAKLEDPSKEKTPKPRSRLANIEAMINSSVDQQLSVSMLEKENFSDFFGSMFHSISEKMVEEKAEEKAPVNKKQVAPCAACRGRKVIHACGKRVKPIDYEAIERARKEKEQKERQAKLNAQARKRREADAKRREAKKKQKEDEKRQKLEEERIQKEMEEQARNALVDAQSPFHNDEDAYSPQNQRNNFAGSYENQHNEINQSRSFESNQSQPRHDHYHHEQQIDSNQSNTNYHNDHESGQSSYFNNHLSETNTYDNDYYKQYSTNDNHLNGQESNPSANLDNRSPESSSHQVHHDEQQQTEPNHNEEQVRHDESSQGSYFNNHQYYQQHQTQSNSQHYHHGSDSNQPNHHQHNQIYQSEQTSHHNQDLSTQHHYQEQQNFHPPHSTNEDTENRSWETQNGNPASNLQNGHPNYNLVHNDDKHHYEQDYNVDSNMNANYYHKAQHTPY